MNSEGRVSLFQNSYNPYPLRTISMVDFFTKSTPGLRMRVGQIRDCGSSERRKKLKESLPCITPSGIFDYRSTSCLKSHSGYVCIDLDKLSNLEASKRQISSLSYVYMCGLSVSGNGLWFLARIADTDAHGEHFDWIKQDVLEKTGFEIDRSCRDITRLRYYSYDQDLYINSSAEIVTGKLKEEMLANENGYYPNDDTRLLNLFEVIRQSGLDITDDRQDWIKIGSAIANRFGDAGYDYFEQISEVSHKFNRRDCMKQWRSFIKRKPNVSTASIFYIAKKYGITLK